MEYLVGIAHALVSPVNCVAGLFQGLANVCGQFVQCVGNNIVGISQTVTNIPL